ncbi:hypothetical protein OW493_10765 [Cobetia sp. 14N.309.X.WAT.E.A4]|uniref:DUF6708 domain-containing protein n=1 Tax=Cobetia sp. 14N.309.X.WAT.E.A4 TaxID=2998323 RepID=UPI0025B27491|nr:DUF6708 domain-containing protein [Cobetia sp. 14N.309.X.WAT.E.A4]MDN2656928.1 hypothetical protein [Cobetia sp. 14N.309.X.WAT.E.A4]
MDFKGLTEGKLLKYPVNRKLTEDEKLKQLNPKCKMQCLPKDLFSVVKMNNRYLEVVDRWYSHKGHSLIYAFGMLVLFFFTSIALLLATINKEESGAWIVLMGMLVILSPLGYIGYKYLRLESFQKTYYPVRFDRVEHKVYAILPRGKFVSENWDDLFIYIEANNIPFSSEDYYEIKAHVLGEDKETVLETFSLGYPAWGDENDAYAIWEFIRKYMEEPAGYKENSKLIDICMPIDNKREGFLFCIFRAMLLTSINPVLQFITSPFMAVLAWCRLFAVYTSKTPEWPSYVKEKYENVSLDKFSRGYENNVQLSFFEGTWPIICFVVGSIISSALIYIGCYSLVGLL